MTGAVRALTDEAYWNAYWESLQLPAEIRSDQAAVVRELTRKLEQHLPRDPSLSALEIGGAPGQYLAYLHRTFGYSVAVLDQSATGCEKARQNFRLLGIDGTVVHGDLFDDVELPRYDIVYSLGLIEHFSDPLAVVERHLRLLKPGGFLALTCPNLLGLNGVLVRRLSPSLMETLDVQVMRPETWARIERRFGLEVLFRGPIGGFEPGLFWRRDRDRVLDRGLSVALKVARRLGDASATRPLRRLNSRFWSAYILGIYRAPSTSA
jgi:SAM-dependent methyltransferase